MMEPWGVETNLESSRTSADDPFRMCYLFQRESRNSSRGGGPGIGSDLEHVYSGIPNTLISGIVICLFIFLAFLLVSFYTWRALRSKKWRPRASDTEKDEAQAESEPKYVCPEMTPDFYKRNKDPKQPFCPEDFNTYWAWIRSIISATDQDILLQCGPDGLTYLRLQRHLMFILILASLVSIGIILPINYLGNPLGNVKLYSHTTMSNLTPSLVPDEDRIKLVWVHIAFSFLMYPLVLLAMKRFSRTAQLFVEKDISQTLMITGIPKSMCQREYVEQHFLEAYENTLSITDIKSLHFVCDIKTAMKVWNNLDEALQAEKRCNEDETEYLYSAPCLRCLPFHRRLPHEDAQPHYRAQIEKLLEDFNVEKEIARNSPVGVAFITFSSWVLASQIYESFQLDFVDACVNRCLAKSTEELPPRSTLSSQLDVTGWTVSYASPPETLLWNNFHGGKRWLFIRKVIANVLILVVVLFLSTPEALLETRPLQEMLGEASSMDLPKLVTDTIPVVAAFLATLLLPMLVASADRCLGHWTRSNEQQAILKKSFWYLIFSIVFLPTFGFRSLIAMVINFADIKDPDIPKLDVHWECFFAPSTSIFYIKYLIMTFLGVALELLRFPDTFSYLMKWCVSRSSVEIPDFEERFKYEFHLGEQYARILLIFSITIMYSMAAPLITLFGLCYFVIKHFVDRYVLLYACTPCKVQRKVHKTAVALAMTAPLLLMFFTMILMFMFNPGLSVRRLDARTMICLVLFSLELIAISSGIWPNLLGTFPDKKAYLLHQ